MSGDRSVSVDDLLCHSRWFTRGWTLQELLAPDEVIIYDREWRQIGTKTTLRPLLQQITGIQDFTNYQQAPVAQKFSWAAKREMTRQEDRAYSLLGIFGVNMPLLCGEGSRAFIRLQKEILNESDDETVFAWGTSEPSEEGTVAGLFATSPRQFINCSDIQRYNFDKGRPAWSMTNHGFQFSAFVWHAIDFGTSSRSLRGLIMVPLNCCRATDGRLLTIFCQRVENPSLPALQGYRRVITAPRYYLNRELLNLLSHNTRTTMTFSPDSFALYKPDNKVKLYKNSFFVCFDTVSLSFYGFQSQRPPQTYYGTSSPAQAHLVANHLCFSVYRLMKCYFNICGYLNYNGIHMDQII